jgi:MoaA/NifB/PqqE/SkfB family radical SAM enzyme/SAM-dependent methyltransferase
MKGSEFFIEAAKRPPFSKLHPNVAAFFKDYLAHEKVIRFGDRSVLNTHFPPYPSAAFDNLAAQFGRVGDAVERRLYSVTLAVTNRCHYRCWHCYNAGRREDDVPLDAMQQLARDLQDMGAVMVTLTGGEPMLRGDLDAIAGAFDARSCVTVGTTGDGLTRPRAEALARAGVFAVGISLDSTDEDEHDWMRGVRGAWTTALEALRIAGESGLYPYVVAVATRDFLRRDRFLSFMRFAGRAGAREVHLLEPSASGRLAGRTDVLLTSDDRQHLNEYQKVVADDETLPILSAYAYIEAPGAFGCGAGLTHLYIDGSGEICPCQLVPISFGNIRTEPVRAILDRMAEHFRQPRAGCAGRILAKHIPKGDLPTPPSISEALCKEHLPKEHAIPRFFEVRSNARGEVGREELRDAYDRVHGDYDEFWLSEAARPIEDLIAKLPVESARRLFEAGCGTGYGTALVAKRMSPEASLLAVDLSEGMIREAKKRLGSGTAFGDSFVVPPSGGEDPPKGGTTNECTPNECNAVRFEVGDALAALETEGPFDLIYTSWVLGYIKLKPFFTAAGQALAPGGMLGFVVHRENSPREPLEIFAELVAEDPTVLQKSVAFDFPTGADHVRREMAEAGLEIVDLCEGEIAFRYGTAEAVLEHLLKSGAGTAFHDAVDPARREALEGRFIGILADRRGGKSGFEVIHEYVACIAKK